MSKPNPWLRGRGGPSRVRGPRTFRGGRGGRGGPPPVVSGGLGITAPIPTVTVVPPPGPIAPMPSKPPSDIGESILFGHEAHKFLPSVPMKPLHSISKMIPKTHTLPKKSSRPSSPSLVIPPYVPKHDPRKLGGLTGPEMSDNYDSRKEYADKYGLDFLTLMPLVASPVSSPPIHSIPIHSGSGAHAMSGSSGSTGATLPASGGGDGSDLEKDDGDGDGGGGSGGASGGASGGSGAGGGSTPPPGPSGPSGPLPPPPKKKTSTKSRIPPKISPKRSSPKGTKSRPSPTKVSPTKTIMSKMAAKYGSAPKMGKLGAVGDISILPAGKGARSSVGSETDVDEGLHNLMQVRMLPSLQRKKDLTPSKASLDKDLTIKSVAITPHSEAFFKSRVLDVNDQDHRMRDLHSYVDDLNVKSFKNPVEKVSWDVARVLVDPELVKNFADDNATYNKLLNDVKADITARGIDKRGDWVKSPLGKLGAFSGYRDFVRSIHIPNKGTQSRQRIHQLAGLIALYKNTRNLPAIQQLFGGQGSGVAPEIKNFTDKERMNIANVEAHQTATPDRIIEYLRDSGEYAKLSRDSQRAVKEIHNNFKEDLIAREHGYLEQVDFIDKIAVYNEGLRNIADDTRSPDMLNALVKAVEHVKTKNLLDWKIFNSRIRFIDETIAKAPNHALAKKLSKMKADIIEGLKTPGKFDLTKAYDKMNGIYKMINNETDKYNTFATKYGLKGLSSGTELLPRVRYSEIDTTEEEKGALRVEKDLFKDKEQVKNHFKNLRNDNFFAFPTLKIVGRKMGIPIATGVRYLNAPNRVDVDKELAHVLTMDVKFDMEQEEKGGTGRTKVSTKANMTDLVYGGEIHTASGGVIYVPRNGWTNPNEITNEFSFKSLLHFRDALKNAVEDGSRGTIKINTRVYHNLSKTGHIIAQSTKKGVVDVSPKGKSMVAVTSPKRKTFKGKDITTLKGVKTPNQSKTELALDIIDLLDDLRNAPEFLKRSSGAPELKVKDAKSVAALKVFPGSRVVLQPSKVVAKKTFAAVPITGVRPSENVEADRYIDKTRNDMRKINEQRKKTYSEGNFKFAKRITKEEPEVNKAYYGKRHIEYDVKNEADLLRMKHEVTKMKGKLYVVDLHTGRLFPIELEHTFVNQNYVFIKDLRSESETPTTKKTKRKTKGSKTLKGGGFGGAISHAAYYPVLHGILRDEETIMPNIFMRNGRDKAKQMMHIAPQIPNFDDYRDQIRNEKGAGMWKYVRKGLAEGAKHAGSYIANKTVAAAKSFGKQSVYEAKHFVNQEKRNITYIGNANKQLYKNPSLKNLNTAVGKTLYGSVKFASQPLISTARETANVSDFAGKVPGLSMVKSGVNFFVPPVAMADALVHGVKNVDDGKYMDAAINAGDALIGSGKLSRGVEMGARLLNTGLKVGDRLGLDKKHNYQPPP